MTKEKLNICQVSLSNNIPIIMENYKKFMEIYKKVNFFIICPKKQKKLFNKKLNFKNIFVISEDKILPFKKFKIISNKHLKKKKYLSKIQLRLKWYYQQVLKISFVIDFLKYKKAIVIWDADTLILKKIKFFKKNFSIDYGTTSEFYKAYYITNKIILKKLPDHFISCLTQFISLTKLENINLKKKLNNFMSKKGKTAEWITNIVFKAIAISHKNYNGSMFSEYELIGQSNLIYKKTPQKFISGLRENLNGKLTNLQKKIAILFGYSYLAYEHTHPNLDSENMLNRSQSWFKFIKLVIRKTSNKLFRSIKYIVLYNFNNARKTPNLLRYK